MLDFIFKKITVPKDNETREQEAVQLWYVRWTARYGKYAHDTKEVMEAFTTPEEAQEFKESLENAFQLLQHTSGTRIKIEKN